MTHEELIAQAREKLEQLLEIWQGKYQIPVTSDLGAMRRQFASQQINLVTTHLAEMDEHQAISVDGIKSCLNCSRVGVVYATYPCQILLTKVKRLLGVEG